MVKHFTRSRRKEHGFALITVMLLVAVLAVMVTAYFMLTQIEMTTAASSQNSTSGFYAAEAGLNIRGQELRETFIGFNNPQGLSPDNNKDASRRACTPYKEKNGRIEENRGEGDFKCVPHNKANSNEIASSRTVVTYVTQPGTPNGQEQVPNQRTLKDGTYKDLVAQEFVYNVNSESYRDGEDLPEARLQTTFRSQLIPLFQFAAFYDQDLEIAPGATMNLSGRVHSNGDLYMMYDNLDILGNVTVAGELQSGRLLDPDACTSARVHGVSIGCGGGTTDPEQDTTQPGYTNAEISEVWQDNEVQQGVNRVQVPEPEFLDRDPEGEQENDYWEKADLRVVLVAERRNGGTVRWEPRVQDAKGKVDWTLTEKIGKDKCGAADTSDTFHDNREDTDIRMLEIDMGALLDCIDDDSSNFGIKDGLKNDTEGGLVFHFSVDDSDLGSDSKADGVNNYGVRVKNGAKLDKKIKGLTVATNQAMYIQGDYNSAEKKPNKKPASFLADSLNILSNDWQDLATDDGKACSKQGGKCKSAKDRSLSSRQAAHTTVNAAFLAGVDETQSEGGYNGGLENYPRLHERWTNKTKLTIRGSFVSLGRPRHVDGAWKDASYKAPERDWDFDTDFLNAKDLPPLSPRFVNLVQQLFTRSFDRDAWERTEPHLKHNTTPGAH